MRVGLIGYGLFGRHHAAAVQELPDCELAAIACSSEGSAAQAGADHPGVPVLRDWQTLLALPDVEAVHIVTPNALHEPMGVAALQAGKHVLLEKPMATTVAGCDALIAAQRASGKVLSVGFELRLSQQWAPIHQLIAEGAIGRPRYVNVALARFPFRPGANAWRVTADQVGSWTLEEPVHHYDFVMWYLAGLGDPVSVQAMGNTLRPGTDPARTALFDNFSSVLRYPDGAYAQITMSLAAFEHHLLVELVGTDGALRAWWSAADARSAQPAFELKLQRKGSQTVELLLIAASGELVELREEIRQTHAGFRAGRPIVSGEEARKRTLVCLEAERSLREGREIPLEF